MKPLSTPRKIFILFCVWSADEAGWKKVVCAIFAVANILANFVGLLASAAFFWKYVSIDLEVSLYGLFTVFGFAIAMYAALIVFIHRQKIYNIFEKLSIIYDESKNLDSFAFLEIANNKSERIWRHFLVYAIGGIGIVTLASSFLSTSLCLYFNGSFNKTMVYVPFRYL